MTRSIKKVKYKKMLNVFRAREIEERERAKHSKLKLQVKTFFSNENNKNLMRIIKCLSVSIANNVNKSIVLCF